LRLPTVAIIGSQNVGKSTLVNRLHGRRTAIAGPSPGTTRDRIEIDVDWRGRSFALVDTGGYTFGAKGIERLVARQAAVAAEGADLILLVVDAHSGITEEDASLAKRLRRSTTPAVLVANKVDEPSDASEAARFVSLGLGEPVAVSALHGHGTGDLLDRVVAILPQADRLDAGPSEPRFAIVGRPNVGKSSIFNRIVGDERSVVFEDAGTTRDPVDALVEGPKGVVRIVDTAGMRRATKTRAVEYHSLLRARRAIERADVVAVVIDSTEPFTSEDKKIAAGVIESGRALAFVANKWDLLTDKDEAFAKLAEAAGSFSGAQMIRTSAKTGLGIHRMLPALLTLRDRWASREPTAKVNSVLRAAAAERPAPRGSGTLRYATQVSSGPPSFSLFGISEPGATYRRFLENRLRATFGLQGVPVVLRFRGQPRRGR
jgi:GTP-binding protein